jgi:hypothetical protein
MQIMLFVLAIITAMVVPRSSPPDEVPWSGADVLLVFFQVKQMFERFKVAGGHPALTQARFDFFKNTIWPRLQEGQGSGLLLLVPDYLDYVRLR